MQSRGLTTLEKNPLISIVGKRENAVYKHFFLFPQCFLLYQRQISPFESPFPLLSATALTHSHTMTPLDAKWETSLLKTLWEKEKLPLMSNFYFSHSVFYWFE